MTTTPFTPLETAERALQDLSTAASTVHTRLKALGVWRTPATPEAAAIWTEYGTDTLFNLEILDDLLLCAQALLCDRGLAALLDSAFALPPPDAALAADPGPGDSDAPPPTDGDDSDPDWAALAVPTAQTDAQRSRIFQLLTDLDMHGRYITAWLHHHFGPTVDLVEELTYTQSVQAIADREQKLAQRARKEAPR